MDLTGLWLETKKGEIVEILNDVGNQLLPCRVVVFKGYCKVHYSDPHRLIFVRRDNLVDTECYNRDLKRAIMEEKTEQASCEREWYKNLEAYANK